ncbi:MAG: hypothetical protein ABF690_15395, partial [Liquorilactobacillus nagelii]
MKTREELLKMFEGDKLFFPKGSTLEDQHRNICLLDILDVLAAPTEEQSKCEYCHSPFKYLIQAWNYYKNKPDLKVNFSELEKDYQGDAAKEYLELKWGDKLTGVPLGFYGWKYCPKCGRRL